MNILFFHRLGINPTGGGVSQITYVLTQEFQKQGHNVYFLGFQTVNGVIYSENQFFLPNNNKLLCEENICFIKQFCEQNHICAIINQNALSLESVEFIDNAIGVYKISVIHNCIFTQYRNFAFQFEYRLKMQRKGWLFCLVKEFPVRNIITWFFILRLAKYYNRIVDCSDAISVMSKGQVKDLKIVLKKKKWNKLYYIPNCINPYPLLWKSRSKTVLWVGTIDFSIKRTDLMLRIWKKVQDNHSDWNLKILGDSQYTNEAKKYADSIGVKNVFFEGRVEPGTYYLDAQIACVTSTHESFSMVIIESFKYGVVPMAFDSFPAATEIINSGHDGIVVPAYDVDEYAKNLSALMDDTVCRDRMRINAHNSAKRYSSSYIYENWRSLLEKA
jgi:glycosyltransferase involved in cell wall biosynthesis